MLKDTDSQIIEDIEEVLVNADKAQEEQSKANAPITQKIQELEIAKLQDKCKNYKKRAKS